MNDIASELAKLHHLTGAEFSRQVECIACRSEFHLLEGESAIFTAGGESSEDYDNLLNAAYNAVAHGYRVFILPNPKGIRTADFILEHKGVYRLYDLKTIKGRNSVSNRLTDSIGQCNRILLNMATDYNTRQLALDIKRYYEDNVEAAEVIIFKGKKQIVVNRMLTMHPAYYRLFKKRYEKLKAAQKVAFLKME